MSIPATLNLTEVQGDDWLITLNFQDANSYVVDLSTSTFLASIRRGTTKNSPVEASFTIDDTNADTGVLILELPNANSALLSRSAYYWDLQETDADNKIVTLIYGKITIINDVT